MTLGIEFGRFEPESCPPADISLLLVMIQAVHGLGAAETHRNTTWGNNPEPSAGTRGV
jgi:hypothetical protein